MPSWAIHNKWCQAIGVKGSVCQEVNRIIDDLKAHDVVRKILDWQWARELFESGGATRLPEGHVPCQYKKVILKLVEITTRFREEGIKATFNHIALDYIAELIKRGFSKKEIKDKLRKKDLLRYIPSYNEVFADISREVKPSLEKERRRREFTDLARSGVRGMFYINERCFPSTSALVHIKSQLEKGMPMSVRWEDSRRVVKRRLSNLSDLKKLIDEIRS